MSVLSRDEYFAKIEEVTKNHSDESITLLEDLTDTYNDLEKRANGDGENMMNQTKLGKKDTAIDFSVPMVEILVVVKAQKKRMKMNMILNPFLSKIYLVN